MPSSVSRSKKFATCFACGSELPSLRKSSGQAGLWRATLETNELWHVDHGDYRRVYLETVEAAQNVLPEQLVSLLSTPQAVALPASFLDEKVRVLVMGQETLDNDHRLSGATPYDAWARQIGGCISFDYAYGAGQASGKFWKAFEELRQQFGVETRRGLAWSNLMKVQLTSPVGPSYSVSTLSADQQMAVIAWQRDLFVAELAYIRPDAILFLTGGMHWILDHLLEGYSAREQGDFRVVEAAGYDIPMAQTWHPNARKDTDLIASARSEAAAYLMSKLSRA